MKYAFVRDHAAHHGIARLCSALEVSRSGYYEWLGRGPSERAQGDLRLVAEIRRVHETHRRAYGAVKTWRTLNAQGTACGKHRVARLRRVHDIQAQRVRRFRLTVEHRHTLAPAPNALAQQFSVPAPDRVWVGDMTFIRTRAGFLYLAILLDLYARRVVGWSMSDRPDLALMLGALNMALQQRRVVPGLIHHTDQAAVYSAQSYRERMQRFGLHPSMSRKGNAYDNAVAESFFSNLKNELVHHCDFHSREAARTAIFDYIEVFYNRNRLHQTLGYRTPAAVERRWGYA